MNNELVEAVARALWKLRCNVDIEYQDDIWAGTHPDASAVLTDEPDDENGWADPIGRNGYRHLARIAKALIEPATLEEAAKVCDVIEDKLTEQWKAGYKVCDYTQGASDGANDCAAAIRALAEKGTT